MTLSYYLLILPLFSLLIIPAFAEEECNFTSYLEKSWLSFGESIKIFGFVTNCDDGSPYDKQINLDRVHIKILDINGKILDNWNPDHITASSSTKHPTQYEYSTNVYRGEAGQFDNTGDNLVTKKLNQYYYQPSQEINSIHFEHRGIYQIQLTYGLYTNTIWFATLDPTIWWEDEE